MMRTGLAILLALSACAGQDSGLAAYDVSQIPRSPQVSLPAESPALSYGGLNEDIRVGNLIVRPLAVTEDSRCPANVTCVWSGRLVLRARVSGMRGEQVISTIEPLALSGGGTLALESVWPQRYHGAQAREPYRFGFRRR